MSTLRPAAYAETLTRSLLLSLGLDQVLIDFLAHTAIGAAAVLLAIVLIGISTPRRTRR